MSAFKDITGQRFGQLVALSFERRKGARPLWTCLCDCGGVALATQGRLKARTKSCVACSAQRVRLAGSRANYRHGAAQGGATTKEYEAWQGIIRRCESPASGREHRLYRGRGISIYPQWRASFQTFLDDVGRAPSPDHSIDRIDNNGNYEPGNVRWATAVVQNNNKRSSAFLEFEGRRMTIAQWATELGLNYSTLRCRIVLHHWPLARALTSPARTKRKRPADSE